MGRKSFEWAPGGLVEWLYVPFSDGWIGCGFFFSGLSLTRIFWEGALGGLILPS